MNPRDRLTSTAASGLIVAHSDKVKGQLRRVHEFRFQGTRVEVRISVPQADYAWAKDRSLAITVAPGERRTQLAARLWGRLVTEPHQLALYDSLGASLHRVGQRMSLDRSEFAEMLVTYVQQMPYDQASVDQDLSNKYPVMTAVEGTGVCADKAVLLAGLLAHEGYQACLFEFPAEHHMTVGLKVPVGGFRGTGFALVETTAVRLIGDPGSTGSGSPVASKPKVIPVSGVGHQYDAFPQVRQLLSAIQTCGDAHDGLRDELRHLLARPNRRGRFRLDHDSLVDRINRCVTSLNAVGHHADDRAALYDLFRSLGALEAGL